MFSDRQSIEKRLRQIREEQIACDKIIAKGKTSGTFEQSSAEEFSVEINNDPEPMTYHEAKQRRRALDQEESGLRQQLTEKKQEDGDNLLEMKNERVSEEEQLTEIPLITPANPADAHAEAYDIIARIVVEEDLKRMLALSEQHQSLHKNITMITNILSTDHMLMQKMQNLFDFLNHKPNRMAINEAQTKNQSGAHYLRGIILSMMAIDDKLKGFSIPRTREEFDRRAIEKMQALTQTFYNKQLNSIATALAYLPDSTLMSLGELTDLGTKNSKFLFKVEHEFKHENEPWTFSIDLSQIHKYLPEFQTGDHYQVKRMAAIVDLVKIMDNKQETASHRVQQVADYLHNPENKKILLAHGSKVRTALTSFAPTVSETYFDKMEYVLTTAEKVGKIIENAAKSANKPR